MIEVVRAPAKLTLSLRVTGRRDDGYHLIDAEMVTLDLVDLLEIAPGDGIEIVDERPGTATHRQPAISTGKDNLIARALDLVGRQAFVRVIKRIPDQAGLGGGSADAAAILRWADFTDARRAAELGADVAFCLVGGRARVTGIGDEIEPLAPLPRSFTLLTPQVRCPTPAVYAAWDQLGGPVGEGVNDLEPAALHYEPRLAAARDELAALSGQRPELAGSGSSWFVEGEFPGPGRRVVRTTP